MKKNLFAMASAALALCMSIGASPVFAANYTPVSGGTTTLDKYLVVEANAEIPAAEFNFSIAAGTPVEATANTVKVWAGLSPAAVKINNTAESGKVTFAAGEAATAANAEAAGKTGLAAKKTITLDFSGVSFPEPGVYRYILTESAGSNRAITNDATPERTIDVYVEDNDGTLAVKEYVVYNGTVTAGPAVGGADAGTKTDKYVNELATSDLSVSKTVTGNQGSKDQYFEFTITLEGLGAGTVVTIDGGSSMEAAPLANAATSFSADAMAAANSIDEDAQKAGQQLIANADGKIEKKFYLKHGQTVKINGIPVNGTYKVVETAAAGYTTTGEVKTATTMAEDANVTVTNNRTGVIPTGVVVSTGLGIGVLAVGAYGLSKISKRRKEEEE